MRYVRRAIPVKHFVRNFSKILRTVAKMSKSTSKISATRVHIQHAHISHRIIVYLYEHFCFAGSLRTSRALFDRNVFPCLRFLLTNGTEQHSEQVYQSAFKIPVGNSAGNFRLSAPVKLELDYIRKINSILDGWVMTRQTLRYVCR